MGIEDEWFDENEQMQWMVSDIAADSQFDDIFDDDANWEQIDEIQTLNGNHLQRRCMHMWGQRLCLCQFMAFMDNRKFQCQPRGDAFVYNPRAPMTSESEIPFQKQDIVKAAVNKEKKRSTQRIVDLNKQNLAIRHKEIEKEKLVEKEKQKIHDLKKDISAIKKAKPAMTKQKMNSVIDKALSKMTKTAKKKEAKKLAAQKKKLLVPKHIPSKFSPIEIPKQRPHWLPDWMWIEFKQHNKASLDEQSKHKLINAQIKKAYKKEKALEHKQMKSDYKKIKIAKQNAKKEIHKAMDAEIKKET